MTNAPPPPMIPNGPTSPNSSSQNTTMDKLQLNLSSENIYRSSANPPKAGWRPQQPLPSQEEAIPSDSLYNGGGVPSSGSASWREKQFGSRPSLNGMAHWSSHGYLAKANDNAVPNSKNQDGYVVLKRQGDQMITALAAQQLQQQQQQQQQNQRSQPNQQPNSLPMTNGQPMETGERKYFSVKGYGDFQNKHIGPDAVNHSQDPKYFSVDARYHSMKNLPPEIRAKLRENLNSNPYQAPPMGQYHQRPPQFGSPNGPAPPVPSRPLVKSKQDSKSGNSVSWHEWTQQLQAYIAWVNSQLRKRPELRPVQDLRTDLQSGEVLAQLIEIISGEKIAGIQYAPESLQGMRENIERILQFMASKRIKMHQITSKEILEGNLKAVMRLILALAAHYKPQSVRHHDNSTFDQQASNDIDKNPPTVEESTLNQTTDEALLESAQSAVKRSPSLNEGHYSKSSKSRLGPEPEAPQIYENFTSSRQQAASQQKQQPMFHPQKISTKATIESPPKQDLPEKPAAFQREGSFVLQREGSFVRTGSGRKLPKIPGSKDHQQKSTSELLNTSLPSPLKQPQPQIPLTEEEKNENRKSKPKALEFWESLETEETVDRTDFRYNTIHRMSVGRRMLPKAPAETGRSHSLDRGSECIKTSASLNSSFSGENDPMKHRLDSESSVPSSPPPKTHPGPKLSAPDGCSLQSHGSSAQPSQPSPPSSDSRGEVEGSSDNNSPPTSVIQGKTNQVSDPWDQPMRNNPAYDWLRGGFKPTAVVNGGKLDEETLMKQLRQQRLGDGHSGSDSKHSDTMSDQGNIPYDILLQDLTQAKRQLLELHNLVSALFDIPKTSVTSLLVFYLI